LDVSFDAIHGQSKWREFLTVSLYKIRCYTQDKKALVWDQHINQMVCPMSSRIYLFSGDNLQEIYSAVETVGSMGDIAKSSWRILLIKRERIVFFDGTNQQELITIKNQNWQIGRGRGIRRSLDVGWWQDMG